LQNQDTIIIDKELGIRLLVTKKIQQVIASIKYSNPNPIPNKYKNIISNLFNNPDFTEIVFVIIIKNSN
jgi:hypothetical protein